METGERERENHARDKRKKRPSVRGFEPVSSESWSSVVLRFPLLQEGGTYSLVLETNSMRESM